jgi:hypothetical protein
VNSAGVYICTGCRDNPGDGCNDSCEMEQLRELPPLWLDYLPTCDCCGEGMQLRGPLVALET